MHKEKPFVLLTVDNDKDPEELRKVIKSGEITWRCWWEGGIGGPIATAWGVEVIPTLFILDHRGVVRHENPGDDQVKQAVDALLESMKSSSK